MIKAILVEGGPGVSREYKFFMMENLIPSCQEGRRNLSKELLPYGVESIGLCINRDGQVDVLVEKRETENGGYRVKVFSSTGTDTIIKSSIGCGWMKTTRRLEIGND